MLVRSLKLKGFDAVLMETRHVRAALSAWVAETDRNDARGRPTFRAGAGSCVFTSSTWMHVITVPCCQRAQLWYAGSRILKTAHGAACNEPRWRLPAKSPSSLSMWSDCSDFRFTATAVATAKRKGSTACRHYGIVPARDVLVRTTAERGRRTPGSAATQLRFGDRSFFVSRLSHHVTITASITNRSMPLRN